MFVPIWVLRVSGLILVLVVILLVFLVVRAAAPSPVQVFIPAQDTTSEVRVHIAGAVVSPGVYTLSANDRVDDAIRAAGGYTVNADGGRLNLAARLKDGDQVFVPRTGEAIPSNTAGAPRININTATQRELETLPGIAEVRARQIIESRTIAGVFQDTLELVSRQILTLSVYERVKDLISTN